MMRCNSYDEGILSGRSLNVLMELCMEGVLSGGRFVLPSSASRPNFNDCRSG